jgi:mannose-6-phosphate isomerase-like protein (cupin superfamily)
MPGFTVFNLLEVEDSAPKAGMPPGIEARFPGPVAGLTESGVSHQRLAPGFRVPFGHRHKRQEELYVVVGGSARLKIDDEVIDLGTWDAVRVAPERMRAFEGGPEGAEILAFGAPRTGPPGGDVEMVPGWWGD